MLSAKIGNIYEKANKNVKKNNSYYVSLLNGKKKATFDTFDEANKFIEMHAHNMIKTEELHAVSIKFTRINKRSTYLIYENVYDENDKLTIVEYEESEYDYMITHSEFFDLSATRRVVNDSYYSFHDILRVKILNSQKITSLKLFFNIFAILISLSFLLLSLNLFHSNSKSQNISYIDLIFLDIFSIILSMSMITISSLLIVMYALPVYKLKSKKWEYHEVNWRSLNKITNNLKISMNFFWSIVFVSIWWFLYKYIDYNLWNSNGEKGVYFLFLIIISIIFVINGIDIILLNLKNFILKNKKLKNFYNESEIEKFKKWVKFESSDVIYKSNEKLFVFPFEYNNELVSVKIKSANKFNETATNQEIIEIRKKIQDHYKKALKSYMNSDKWGK
ncbi:MAG: hypothetical protein HRT99_03075 [Mycoplasmatales bacterium]|nr:hypothetical protein [Mycoplasmatales bacterium]